MSGQNDMLSPAFVATLRSPAFVPRVVDPDGRDGVSLLFR
jgi:hypothetical protein